MIVCRIILLAVSASIAAAAISHCAAEDADRKNRHARWERAISRFEEADLADPGPRQGILFVGSSSIRFWNLNRSFPDQPVIGHGFGGSQIDDTIHFADRIVWPFKPKVIVFYAGDNDVAAGKSAKVVADDFKTFSTLVHQHLPDTHLIYIAIKPSIARWSLADKMKQANAAIAQQCEADDQRTFLDVWTPMLTDDGEPDPKLFVKDGLHLNKTGYKLWTDLVTRELTKQQATVTSQGTNTDQ